MANDKVDSLEMDNYNLREQFSEQLKLLEEYRFCINDLEKGIEIHGQAPTNETAKRVKENLTRLIEMISQTQLKFQQSLSNDGTTLLMDDSGAANVASGDIGPTSTLSLHRSDVDSNRKSN